MFSVVLGGDPLEISVSYFEDLKNIAAFMFKSLFDGSASVWGLYIGTPILAGVFMAWVARRIVEVLRRI